MPAPKRDSISRFTDRATEYARARPSYPAPAIDAILEGAHDPHSLTIADVGAGTGIASRLFAERELVAQVFAVEPNAAMRAAARPNPRITWIDATGERTTLDDALVDVVTCAQAFHWLDADAALAEFARIINPASPLRRVVLLWNEQDDTHAPTAAYRGLMDRHAVVPRRSDWIPDEVEPLRRSPHFTDYRRLSFSNAQSLDLDGLFARAFSASFIPNEGPAHEAVRRDLIDLFTTHARHGVLTLTYATHLHIATLA